MARNGSGVYSLPAGNPVVTLTTISTGWANSTLTDIGDEITNSIDKGGRTTPTANLPMGGFKHTGVGNASAAGQYLNYGQAGAALAGPITLTSPAAGTQLTATTAIPNVAQFSLVNTDSSNTGAAFQATNNVSGIAALLVTGTTATAYGGRLADEANLYSNRNINIMADNASGGIKFQTGGNTTRAQISATGQIGVGLAPSANFQVQLLNETGGGSNQGFSLVGAGSTRQFNFGINSTSGVPWIQGWIPGTGASDIAINPQGGATAFGGALSYSFVNTTVTQRQLTSINASATGQSGIGFTINGTERGALRVDYVGNTNYVSNGGDHYWYTGGDAGVGTNRLVLTADGRLYGTALHNNAGSMTGTANQYVGSGTQTGISSTTVANLSAVSNNVCRWMRVGNVVHVTGSALVTITAASTYTAFRCALPIPSAFTTGDQVAGVGKTTDGASTAAYANGDAANDEVLFNWTSGTLTGVRTFYYSYSYEVL